MPVVLLCFGVGESDPKGIQVLSAESENEIESMSDKMCMMGQQRTMVTTGTELQVDRNSIILNQIEACIYYGEKKEERILF